MYDNFHRRGSRFLGECTNSFKCILNLQHQEGIRRQFKVPILSNHGSWKISVGAIDNSHHEHLPILSDHDHKVIIKIDDGDRVEEGTTETMCKRGSSFKFFKYNHQASDDMKDPPSRLTSKFLNRENDAGSEMILDMDLEMDELRDRTNCRNVVVNQNVESPIKGTMINNESVNPNSRALNSRELRVSSQRSDESSKVLDIKLDNEQGDQAMQRRESSDEE
ncbi:hypothetical protein L6452_25141 [Arctium lappa]|uniref:Uncharacterized protein n=1 Tax=Arctium lappa TaxID=4217 RepID=A0ACB9ACC3_ARCLA|nr:hypothetical protein L6452_25141 [Arctium lappa]